MSAAEQSPAPSLGPGPFATDLRAAFAEAFRTAARSTSVDVSRVRALVYAYVRAAKARGNPPERVIIALKELTIADVHWYLASAQQLVLREQVIRWCLDEYYGASAPAERTEALRRIPRENGRAD